MQTAAIVGLGLVFEGTVQRHMVEVLLAEIGRRPSDDRRQDREGYALAAGLALGMVTLAQGRHAPGLSDMDIEDTLRRYIDGGSRPRGFPSAASAIASGRDKVDPTTNPSGAVAPGETPGHSSLVFEGTTINVDITAAGAMLALSLMFLKTNSIAVAERLAVPSTIFLLETMRPDLLLLRVLCRSLILWDSVQPSLSWIHSHVPFVLLSHLRAPNSVSARSHRFGGKCPGSFFFSNIPNTSISYTYCRDTVQQAYLNILAGACMAIGIRFAGSADKDAADVLFQQLAQFSNWRAGRPGEGADQVDGAMAEALLCSVAVSLSLVLAGTGNVRLLGILRTLHMRVSAGVSYGNHMAITTALSLLFLGAGRYTLSTSNSAIAAMLAALYPLYPAHPHDNRYHLQVSKIVFSFLEVIFCYYRPFGICSCSLLNLDAWSL